MPRINPHIPLLAQDHGIIFPGAIDYRNSQAGLVAAQALLMDAAPTNLLQSQLVTAPNAGIPAYLTNYLDPELTRVLTAPTAMAEIFGEAKKGDWVTKTAMFPLVESTGEVSTYGDYNNNGLAGANMNWEPRQSYTYQAFTRWGDEELEKAGLGKIDWAAEQNVALAITFSKFQNKTYAFGVAGLDNFGALNDPSLPAPIAATGAWSGLTGLQIWADLQRLFKQLQKQLNGNLDAREPMKLCLSPFLQPSLLTVMSNTWGNATVQDMLKTNFPQLKIMTAVEYATTSGELVQLKVDRVEGQTVSTCAFTEKMRAHAIVRDTSSTFQKKSAGSWGTIIKVPAGIASLIGA